MKKTKLISLIAAAAMVISVVPVRAGSAELEKLYEDTFDTNAAWTTKGTTGNVNNNWKVANGGYASFGIAKGQLLMYGERNYGTWSSVAYNGGYAERLSAAQKFSADIASYRTGAFTSWNEGWYMHGCAVSTRFCVSEDGKSFYELGVSGYRTDDYDLPISVDPDGTEGAMSKNTNKPFFRKVEDGKTVYIAWDDSVTDYYARWANMCYAYDTDLYNSGNGVDAATEAAAAVKKAGGAHVEVTVDGGNVSYSLKIGTNAAWTGTYTNNYHEGETTLARKGAPVMFGACGGEKNDGIMVDNFVLYGEYQSEPLSATPDFAEDFSSYTSATTSALGFDNRWTLNDHKGEVIATHPSGAEWKVSSSKVGRSTDGKATGYAYIDASGKKMTLRGRAAWDFGCVDLDIKDMDKLQKVTFTTYNPSRTAAIGLFVDETNTNGLYFGIKNGETVANFDSNGISKGVPYVITVSKDKNDTSAMDFKALYSTSDTVINEWPSNTTLVNWTVLIERDKDGNPTEIDWVAEGNGKSKGVITDPEVLAMVDNFEYPLCAMAAGDGESSSVKDIKVWYTAKVMPKADFALKQVASLKDGDTATMRFIFDVEHSNMDVTNFGAHLIPFDIFDNFESQAQTAKYEKSIESGNEFTADLIAIPASAWTRGVVAVPFANNIFGAATDSYTVDGTDVATGSNVVIE